MKKGLKIIVIALAAVIITAALVILAFYMRISDPENVFGDIAGSTPTASQPVTPTAMLTVSPSVAEPTLSPDAGQTAEVTPAPTPTPTPEPLTEEELAGMADGDFMSGRVNVLLLGVDKSIEREESGSFRTDTMILVSVSFKTMDVNMISIPRDSYVKLYGPEGALIDEIDPFNKINAAFSLGGGLKKGGYESAKNTVSALLGGVRVDYFAAVDMNAVKNVVNAMGGVDYDVDTYVYMNGRELFPGMQHLDGQGVLDYCRMRKGSSDVARADRQQRMLKALFDKLKTTGQIANAPKIYTAVQDSIETDLSFEQICALALVALRMDMTQLERDIVEGRYESVYKRDCWLVDGEKLNELMARVFGEKAQLKCDPETDGEAVLAAVSANRAAIQNELYNAGVIYNETVSVMKQYKRAMSDARYSLLSKNRSMLATYIRRECAPYMVYYTDTLNALLYQAYAEAGAVRQPPQLLSVGQGSTDSGYDSWGIFNKASSAVEEDITEPYPGEMPTAIE